MSKANKLRTAALARAAGSQGTGGTQTSGMATSLSVTPAQGPCRVIFFAMPFQRINISLNRLRTYKSCYCCAESEGSEREVVRIWEFLIRWPEGPITIYYHYAL